MSIYSSKSNSQECFPFCHHHHHYHHLQIMLDFNDIVQRFTIHMHASKLAIINCQVKLIRKHQVWSVKYIFFYFKPFINVWASWDILFSGRYWPSICIWRYVIDDWMWYILIVLAFIIHFMGFVSDSQKGNLCWKKLS